jgi:SPP1 gp7 family putative phage head morphogenesis protein
MARLDKLAGTNALNVANTIIDNVALGKNPKTIAGLIKNSLGGGLTDALRMTRTLQIYSYRESARASYLANADIVTGWVWYAALDDKTCEACYIEHGTFHKNDETLNGHYNCRCSPLPVTIGSENPITESGIDLFNAMDESGQRALVGDSKYDLISSGKIEFQDLLTTRNSDVYGDMVAVAPIKDLIGE